MTAGPRPDSVAGGTPCTLYPFDQWAGLDDIEVSIVFRSRTALMLVLTRLADRRPPPEIGLEATLFEGLGNELWIGAYPDKNRGRLGFAPRAVIEATRHLPAYPTLWALGATRRRRQPGLLPLPV